MTSLEHYLNDLGFLVKQEAMTLKSVLSDPALENREFYAGKLFAYYEVLSMMLSQATAFQIESSVFNLDGFNPDQDLL